MGRGKEEDSPSIASFHLEQCSNVSRVPVARGQSEVSARVVLGHLLREWRAVVRCGVVGCWVLGCRVPAVARGGRAPCTMPCAKWQVQVTR